MLLLQAWLCLCRAYITAAKGSDRPQDAYAPPGWSSTVADIQVKLDGQLQTSEKLDQEVKDTLLQFPDPEQHLQALKTLSKVGGNNQN